MTFERRSPSSKPVTSLGRSSSSPDGRAYRTLRYQRAALPTGQFSMTPTVSYPSRS
jgi:hypothetical protein